MCLKYKPITKVLHTLTIFYFFIVDKRAVNIVKYCYSTQNIGKWFDTFNMFNYNNG